MHVSVLYSDPALGAMIFVSYFCNENFFWYFQEMKLMIKLNKYNIKK